MAQVIALAMSVGFGHAQADAIGHYSYRAAHIGTHYSLDAELDPCANSWRGEGLIDVVGNLRGELRRYAQAAEIGQRPFAADAVKDDGGRAVPDTGRAPVNCIPAQVQLAFLKEAFAHHYPKCWRRFLAGQTSALQECWGDGGPDR